MRTCEHERSLERPLNTLRAQSGPRLACALYVLKIMQVNDWWRVSAPRASTGRAGGIADPF